MAMFDSLIEKLGESPQVQEAFGHLTRIRDVFTKSMIRMDQRFDESNAKLDRILMHLENPSSMVPAKDDGLLKALEAVNVQECHVMGCTNTAVHDHGDGVAVQVKPLNITDAGEVHERVQ